MSSNTTEPPSGPANLGYPEASKVINDACKTPMPQTVSKAVRAQYQEKANKPPR